VLFRSDEGAGKIYADNLAAMPGQFEGGPAHSAADIQGARITPDGRRIEQLPHATLGKSQRVTRTGFPGKNFLRFPVVKKEIFADQPVAFVNVPGHRRVRSAT